MTTYMYKPMAIFTALLYIAIVTSHKDSGIWQQTLCKRNTTYSEQVSLLAAELGSHNALGKYSAEGMGIYTPPPPHK